MLRPITLLEVDYGSYRGGDDHTLDLWIVSYDGVEDGRGAFDSRVEQVSH